MPYYNITLTDNPVQSKNAGTIEFADEIYWVTNEDINMVEQKEDNSGYKNNIQKYIEKYKTIINNLLEKDINVRVCTKSELDSGLSNTLTNNEKKDLRNPGKTGYFWLGTAHTDAESAVYSVAQRWFN